MNRKQVYSVSSVNQYIKSLFMDDFALNHIYVRGEVSNCKYHSSGHIYFTLKDRGGAIACVMFAGNRKGLNFRMSEGMAVIVYGSVSVYERDGKYQLYAREIIQEGAGRLYEAYEALKKKLLAEGLFDEEHKQKIPKYPKRLGVVTARTGAAVQDIINVSLRRNPWLQIVFCPAAVQGDGAAQSVVRGIHALEAAGVDVMIVGRGGGSIEDLWAFNEEAVAQAVFDCTVPIISAVGHETDTTIIDFVSDLRAPTPSAAAELAVYDIRQLEALLEGCRNDLNARIRNRIEWERSRIRQVRTKLQYLSPANQIREKRMYALRMEEQLSALMKQRLMEKRHMLGLYTEKLKGLSPLDKLNQGFSYVSDSEGKTVSDVKRVAVGDRLSIHVKNGKIEALVTDKELWKKEKGED